MDDIIKTAVKTAEVEEQKREKKTWKSYQSVIYSPERLVARLFMFLLIFNEQRVLKFTFVLVLTYYVNHSLEGAPHLLTAIGWSIVNIQSDPFWHRCLERQAFGTPRMYTLSFEKYKEK
jgi:hypothetical protein